MCIKLGGLVGGGFLSGNNATLSDDWMAFSDRFMIGKILIRLNNCCSGIDGD